MGWESNETQNIEKGMDTSLKILLTIIACLALVIIIIVVLLFYIKETTYIITVDKEPITEISKDVLLTNIGGNTYINIEEFAKIVDYEYHVGEYKGFGKEEDRCYVQGEYETATFYLNENKVYKLPIDEMNEKYQEYEIQNPIEEKDGEIYAPLEAIRLAFNVQITENKKSLTVNTLNNLVAFYDKEVTKLGYTGIVDQTFENQKSILYDCLIVKKEEGLYKIINKSDKEEIVSDKYTTIDFDENLQQFIVEDSLERVGVINLDGTIKIEPIYNSISILDRELDLYVIEKDSKYGVVKGENIKVINPEYDGIGFRETSVEIKEVEKTVNPVYIIDECEGIVVEKDNQYGVVNFEGNIVVPIQVDSIYSIVSDDNKLEYYMIYNGKELNIIKMLVDQGIIEDPNKKEDKNDITNEVSNKITNEVSNKISNEVSNNAISNEISSNTILNTVENDIKE